MEAGETIKCRIFKGGSVTVTLEDRVYPDASAHQYEAGWWCFDANANDYFISESGTLWDFEKATGNFSLAIGLHVPWLRRVKKMEAELESLIRDEEINRSFDAYR
jgi:hypothetical protein